MNTETITIDENLIAFCGLYCGACPKYLKNECNGCAENNPSWCKVKPCNVTNNYSSCAECKEFNHASECKKHNSFMIKVGEFITRTSRAAAIDFIKNNGRTEFAKYMSENKLVSMKK